MQEQMVKTAKRSNGQKSAQERIYQASIRPKAKGCLTQKSFYLKIFNESKIKITHLPGMDFSTSAGALSH